MIMSKKQIWDSLILVKFLNMKELTDIVSCKYIKSFYTEY